jgi:hypothetical protein
MESATPSTITNIAWKTRALFSTNKGPLATVYSTVHLN